MGTSVGRSYSYLQAHTVLLSRAVRAVLKHLDMHKLKFWISISVSDIFLTGAEVLTSVLVSVLE